MPSDVTCDILLDGQFGHCLGFFCLWRRRYSWRVGQR
jgi:hypothetical protein